MTRWFIMNMHSINVQDKSLISIQHILQMSISSNMSNIKTYQKVKIAIEYNDIKSKHTTVF